jgi:DNA-binding CsgD family transcriptional regulator
VRSGPAQMIGSFRLGWVVQGARSRVMVRGGGACCEHRRRCAWLPGLADELRGPAVGRSPGQLSVRERELVVLVAQGHTDAQIAAQLYISIRTVRSHLDRIRDKTGCRRRADPPGPGRGPPIAGPDGRPARWACAGAAALVLS